MKFFVEVSSEVSNEVQNSYQPFPRVMLVETAGNSLAAAGVVMHHVILNTKAFILRMSNFAASKSTWSVGSHTTVSAAGHSGLGVALKIGGLSSQPIINQRPARHRQWSASL